MEAPRLVRTNYVVRTGAFAYCFLVVGLHLFERGAPPGVWLLFLLQFLAYPHLIYWRAMRSAHPTRAELDNLYIDAALVGLWAAYLGLPTWITYALLAGTMLNATVNRGLQGAVISFACSALGVALYVASSNFHYSPQTSDLVSAQACIGILAYTCAVGYVVNRQNRRIGRAVDQLRVSEERYRLIAENVADLIGMVDPDSRWLYTSPSYAHVLPADDLLPGVDAFRRAHPDDAGQARVAVLRVAATGKARELVLRLIDREGRTRQFRTRIQAVAGEAPMPGAPRERLILVSRDITDLRVSEERLLLQAQALEGMTQAVLITTADGTVLTVNRAFCEITGYRQDEVLGQSEKTIANGLEPVGSHEEVLAAIERDGYWSGTVSSRRKNGLPYRQWRSIRPIRDPAGRITHYVTTFSEVEPGRNKEDARDDARGAQ